MIINKYKVILVDDNDDMLLTLEHVLSDYYQIRTANTVLKAKQIIHNNKIDVAVVDLNFEGHEDDGLSLINFIEEKYPYISIVVLSGDSNTKRVVETTKHSIIDFITKDDDFINSLKIAIKRGYERKVDIEIHNQYSGFETNSTKMKTTLDMAARIITSKSKAPILITGETGTGKEVLTKHIAKQMKKTIVAANMASIPNNMVESELFGYVKGAFTGANCTKAGLIEQAHGGIFFLDEISECSLSVQAKLLRVVQECEILPVGGVKTKKIDVRFISASNRNLEDMIKDGTFRQDLFQRINTITLHIPPLRERPEDIISLVDYFLKKLSPNNFYTIESSAIDEFLTYSWPGNVRELKNVVERIIIFSKDRTINTDMVSRSIGKREHQSEINTTTIDIAKNELTRSKVIKALIDESGNRSKAAFVLGIHKSTLYRMISKYGISDIVAAANGDSKNIQTH